ncbi:MAG: helix-turn-helix domain-containing protein [Xanthobacteraceae bacterium]|nr:helix-turn-helix transcriptional regulator [Xanthobacteraceae bacterium]MBX3548148.1 helix-turn-helix transcriptional regulator [Xanthobacteraceae bacterium]
MTRTKPAGEVLREWRQRRRMTQLDLALDADISAKHLSFLETGRAQPSREMVLNLAERLEMPLRERNGLLVAAGFAPMFSERPLSDPSLAKAREAVELVLKGHEPYPAVAVDRHWNIVSANRPVGALISGASPALLKAPVNIMRLSLHPEGLARQIVNFHEVRAHLIARLRRQIELSGDAQLAELLREISAYPKPSRSVVPIREGSADEVVIRTIVDTPAGRLSLFSTMTIFGSPVDVTLSELAIESFFPADSETAAILRKISE